MIETGTIKDIIPKLLNLPSEVVYDFKIEEHKEKRSLNANAYAWVLITKISNILRASKEEIYFLMLKRYGVSEVVSIISNIDVTGYFKYYEEFGRSVLNNKEFTHYKIFKGSSEYNTKEMSILIDGIVSEAKNLGIETLDEIKLKGLIDEWKVCE
jgi:hypothetical protein